MCISNPESYVLFFDGCSKGNPGNAGAGAVLYKNEEETWSQSLMVGIKQTNNYAEYMGLIIGLEEAVRLRIIKLIVKGDSLLVIKQMKGEYKVKSPNIIELYNRAMTLANQLPKVEFIHVYRKYNKRADALSNEALKP